MRLPRGRRPELIRLITGALAEDAASADITTLPLFQPRDKVRAEIVARGAGVVAGLEVASLAFKTFDKSVFVRLSSDDGKMVQKGEMLLSLAGPARSILAAERTALNFLGHMSGVATLTRRFVDAAGKNIKILDTRKTIPGLRILQKYAVTCGGGENYRDDLSSMVMIKDNHVAAYKAAHPDVAPGDLLQEMVRRTKRKNPRKKIVVEVDSQGQLLVVLPTAPDIVMLDNFTPARAAKAVATARAECRKLRVRVPEFEASGGINEKNIIRYANTGVTRISIGAITHSVPAFDLSLDVVGTQRQGKSGSRNRRKK